MNLDMNDSPEDNSILARINHYSPPNVVFTKYGLVMVYQEDLAQGAEAVADYNDPAWRKSLYVGISSCLKREERSRQRSQFLGTLGQASECMFHIL